MRLVLAPLIVDGSTLPTGPDAIAAGLGTTSRDDGAQQVTYNGVPLYYWIKDSKPSDTLGQGVNGELNASQSERLGAFELSCDTGARC